MSAGAIVALVFIGWAIAMALIFWLYVRFFGGKE